MVIVDEASMVGTPELKKLLSCAIAGRAKMVLVGDAYQLAPVKARGGMFEQLCADLPWSQRLGEVWRMRDPEERDTSLALRAAHGNRLRNAVEWYRDNGRLHTGDPIAMAADALDAYLNDRAASKDALLICDTWEMADALNRRLHDTLTTPGPTVKAARDQRDRRRRHHHEPQATTSPSTCTPAPAPGDRVDQVRNGNRWRVAALDPERNRIAAERLTDKARAVFDADYLREHVTLGYAATVHSAQGVTADSSYAILGEGGSRAMAYVAMTRGRHNNEAFLYQKFGQRSRSRPRRADRRRPRSTGCAAATSTRPRTTSNRSCATTTGPAPCMPKPNAPPATCSPTRWPTYWTRTTRAAQPAARSGANTPPSPGHVRPPTNAWPKQHPPAPNGESIATPDSSSNQPVPREFESSRGSQVKGRSCLARAISGL